LIAGLLSFSVARQILTIVCLSINLETICFPLLELALLAPTPSISVPRSVVLRQDQLEKADRKRVSRHGLASQ